MNRDRDPDASWSSTRELELCPLTVLHGFLALHDGQRKSAATGSQQRDRLIAGFRELSLKAIESHQGTAMVSAANELVGCFGWPAPDEQAALNAARAALEVLAEAARANPDLQRRHGLRCEAWFGIHSSLGMVGVKPGLAAADASVSGEAAVVARQLAQAAGVLVSQATYQRIESRFACHPVRQLTIPGIAKSIQTYQVVCEKVEAAEEAVVDSGALQNRKSAHEGHGPARQSTPSESLAVDPFSDGWSDSQQDAIPLPPLPITTKRRITGPQVIGVAVAGGIVLTLAVAAWWLFSRQNSGTSAGDTGTVRSDDDVPVYDPIQTIELNGDGS